MARTFRLGFRGLDERLPVTGVTSSSCCSLSIRSMLPYDCESRLLLAEVVCGSALLLALNVFDMFARFSAFCESFYCERVQEVDPNFHVGFMVDTPDQSSCPAAFDVRSSILNSRHVSAYLHRHIPGVVVRKRGYA